MSWPMVKLGDIAIHIRNGASIKQNESSGGLPISRIETIANREVNFDKCGYADLGPEDYKEYRLASGDILISHINSEKHLGKCAIFESDRDDLVHGMNLLCMRPKDTVFPKFVFYYLSSELFLSKIPNITKKSVNQASFTVTSFKELEIPLPPLAEQKRIAAILDKADAIRRKRQQAIQLADDFLRAVFLEMFGDPVTNPKGWDRQSLDKVAPVLPFKKKVAEHENVWLLNLDAIEAQSGKIIHKLIVPYTEVGSSTNHFNELHVLYSKLRPYLNKVVIPNSEGMATSELLTLLPSQNKMTREFLAAYLRSKAFVSWANTKVAGAKMPRLSTVELKKHQIFVPPLQLQQEFSQRFRHVLDMVERSKEVLKTNDIFFNCLSQKAFSGQL